MSWNEHANQHSIATLRQSQQRICAWLERHGVPVHAHLETGLNVGISEAIRWHLKDLGADLLVMGAWGHARWAERLLGGATRGLLDLMTLPVLMSH